MNENHSNGPIVAASVIGVVGITGLATALLLVFAGPAGAHHSATPTPTPSSSSSGTATNNSVPFAPSASVELLQRELGQLNYYEGPINGVMTPQTIQAIKYLQRDSHLSQTGELNQATDLALQRMLVNGNNQMAG